jgi:hypothetical protein
MLSHKFLASYLFHLTLLALSSVFLLSACEQKAGENKAPPLVVKSEVIRPIEIAKIVLKPECLPSTGSAMEDGQVEICHYNTDSIEQAYETIVKEHAASNDDSGYSLLQKSLPSKDLEANFDMKETWIKYKWADKEHVTVIIQMAGGEDTLEFAKEASKVKVTTTLSAD